VLEKMDKAKGRVEKVVMEEDGGSGLSNRRDRDAFVLLIVLCTSQVQRYMVLIADFP
jgi:hypothetical protein